MNQYCRYCSHAIDYNGEGTDFVCTAVAPCGANGSGEFYPAKKAKRINKCKYYDHNGRDIFRFDRNGEPAEYKPREPAECDFDMIPAPWA